MFTIGDFARHGRVRMLRDYNATGLLRPAHVDPATGYRCYTGRQLARLNRVIALKGSTAAAHKLDARPVHDDARPTRGSRLRLALNWAPIRRARLVNQSQMRKTTTPASEP